MHRRLATTLTLGSAILLLSLVGFSVLDPVVASMVTADQSLSLYMADGGKLAAFEQEVGDFSQIGIQWGRNKEIITDDRFAHSKPQVYGHQVVWSAQKGSQWQLFLYDALANQTQQLTFTGNNVNPFMSASGIVWEGQVDDQWRIFVYKDGQVFPISDSSQPIQDLTMNNNLIAYSQKNLDYGWQVYLYNLDTKRSLSVTPESSSYKPSFQEGRLRWQIPLYQNGLAWGEMNLATEEVVVADSVAELDEIYQVLFSEASSSAQLQEKYGHLDTVPLLESLQVLGIIDQAGRVIEN